MIDYRLSRRVNRYAKLSEAAWKAYNEADDIVEKTRLARLVTRVEGRLDGMVLSEVQPNTR